MRNYNNNDGDKSLEREFAERVELIGYSEAYDELIALIAITQRRELMGDPSAIVTFMEGVAISSLVKGDIYKLVQTIFGKTTEQVSELLTKEIKYLEMQRTIDVLISIDRKLKEAGINPQTVNLHKILIPVFQAISIEDDSDIEEMYTNLLTAAITGEKVSPDEIQILGRLSTDEILILETLHQRNNESSESSYIQAVTKLTEEDFEIAIDRLIAKGLIKPASLENIEAWRTYLASGITRDRGVAEYIGGESLRAADLEAIESAFRATVNQLIDLQTIDKYRSIGLTKMGRNFMKKCKGTITKSIDQST